MHLRSFLFAAAFLCCPLAHAQWTTMINVPPVEAPTSIGSDTQLNVGDGGIVYATFWAGAADGSSTNVEVNLDGGRFWSGIQAYHGATVNLNRGNVSGWVEAFNGSVVNMTGGSAALLWGRP